MEPSEKTSDRKLLYDPMFAKKPQLNWTDSEKGGFFGKAIVKKAVFILILIIAIGCSIYFSFSSISKNLFEYSILDDGTAKISAFNGGKNDTVLCIDYLRSEENVPDTQKPVTAIRKYTVTGNENLQFIFIGKDVQHIEFPAFYYCPALLAVYTDEANESFASVDGILYRKENGKLTEALLCPAQHTKYLEALADGLQIPQDEKQAATFAKEMLKEEYADKLNGIVEQRKEKGLNTVTLPQTVTKIGQLCFSYCDKMTGIELPDGLKEIETMAFFKCSGLTALTLPDGIETIGSDAFSKCKGITYLFLPKSVKAIGHHAFWDCSGIEKVYMESDSLDGIELGHDWQPQYRKTFEKKREIQFSSVRGVK